MNQNNSKMLSYNFRKNTVSKIISAESGTIATVIDSIVISKFLGLDAMGAYGIAVPVVYFIIALAKLFSDGGARQCGISIGKADRKRSNSVYSTSIISAMLMAVAIMIIILTAPKWVARLLGANGSAVCYLNGAAEFLRGYAWGIPGHILLLTLIPFAQLDGKISSVSVAGYSMAAVDVLLDFANVFVFRYGLFGMALATSISEYIGAIILCIALSRKNSEFHFSLRLFDPRLIIKLRWSGIPGFFSYFYTTVRSVVANYTIAAFLPIWLLPIYSGVSSLMNLFYPIGKGIGSTVMVFSSLFYGEEDKNSLKQILSNSNIFSIISNLLLTLIIIAFAPYLLRIFLTLPAEEMVLATHGARLMALSLVPFSLHTVFRSYMQGIGRIIHTILFLGIYECIISTAAVYVLSKFYGVEGFWISFIAREILALMLAFGFALILRGKSKNKHSVNGFDFLIFDKFGINENESFEGSVYNISELNEFANSAENVLCTADNNVKDLTTYINSVGNSVFSRTFPLKQIPELRIRIYKKDGMWTLHFRDNGDQFAPTKQEAFDGFNTKYIRSMNQNVLIMQQQNHTT